MVEIIWPVTPGEGQVQQQHSPNFTSSKRRLGVLYLLSRKLSGKVERKPLLVVVSVPQFTSKPPSKIVSILNCRTAVRLNCSATGDPQPTISWIKQGGQLMGGASRSMEPWLLPTYNRVMQGITFALLQVLACSLRKLRALWKFKKVG